MFQLKGSAFIVAGSDWVFGLKKRALRVKGDIEVKYSNKFRKRVSRRVLKAGFDKKQQYFIGLENNLPITHWET